MNSLHKVIWSENVYYCFILNFHVYDWRWFSNGGSFIWQEGYAVSRSHIALNAIKTDCSMANCIQIAKRIQQLDVSSDMQIE